ncbi:MAG: glycosyltransferase [Candidatus Eisenbacteria bacterium]|uniref:Glycosyltransferase n=1 Tax=Eiseniibacteriota bacterium TaxID=2212470 RepID=A0A948RRA2_UNCEI|nr:glycosyltransferase [Candidatus Eisenbacteria bacterium]MBU1949205.1 glycosyltransferase [Candidatus Eisenbacteria bacterium]MBU2689430.1 glycosyltransferase [Candidatus Eisenbacteria bacterium]
MNPHPDITGDDGIEVSIVCTPGHYARNLAEIHREFREILDHSGRKAEFLYIINANREETYQELSKIVETKFPVRIMQLSRGFSEAASLNHAFEVARGHLIITIPDHFQIDPGILPEILKALDSGVEVVLTRREPRKDALINRLQSRLFHMLAGRAYPRKFRDLTCGLRGFKRDAARKLDLYGDLHRFIPILAAHKGFRMVEIPGGQREEDHSPRIFGPGVYARRLLDVLHILFVTRFTRKPLRFFGLVGLSFSFIGVVICLFLLWSRLVGKVALADRPMLLLGVVLIVLGVQIVSTGLLGEIIIFFTADREKPEVMEGPPQAEPFENDDTSAE